jgi:hypothetical protein
MALVITGMDSWVVVMAWERVRLEISAETEVTAVVGMDALSELSRAEEVVKRPGLQGPAMA